MSLISAELKLQINKCATSVHQIFAKNDQSHLSYLNLFCLDFLKVAECIQMLLKEIHEADMDIESEDYVEIIYLCLLQIIKCIKYLESTIKAEHYHYRHFQMTRQHFIDRITWNLNYMYSSIEGLDQFQHIIEPKPLEEMTFAQLMDLIWDQLTPFGSYDDGYVNNVSQNDDVYTEMMMTCKQIRYMVDLVIGHILAFANVSFEDDKRALSALCQKVHRESLAFHQECFASWGAQLIRNSCNRRLKAISLDNALCQLEDYINDALLRLIYHCFIDFDRFSIKKLRTAMSSSQSSNNESTVDMLIADFDINIDRATQIGTIALGFATNLKVKTHLRSCLASFESLDSCVIPALQAKGVHFVNTELLEKHFNEEIACFKNCLHEILNGYVFAGCYYEMLHQTIFTNKQNYSISSLEKSIQMAAFVCEHFEIKVNQHELEKHTTCMDLFQKFVLMVNECKAVIKCHADKMSAERVLMRFKVLRCTLHKFLEVYKNYSKSNSNIIKQYSAIGNDLSTKHDFQMTTPSAGSLALTTNSYTGSDSLKGNCSNLPVTPMQINSGRNGRTLQSLTNQPPLMPMHKRDSLRIALFKRQTAIDKVDTSLAESIQISDILNQLSALSSQLPAVDEAKQQDAISKT